MACNSCKKEPPEVTLKRCAKCSTTQYCSRVCQKNDWKVHKKICGKNKAEDTSEEASDWEDVPRSPPKGLDQPIEMPFTRLDAGTYLHDRPEKDVYRLLIDAYRLRVEDNYTFQGVIMDGTLYAGCPSGLTDFRRFLKKAATVPGLLPPWWNFAKSKACEKLGMADSEWSDLRCAVEKSDVMEHYQDHFFPMQLRMLADAVYGSNPYGASRDDGTEMRKTMMAIEQGQEEQDANLHFG